jgi:hypothetical protein
MVMEAGMSKSIRVHQAALAGTLAIVALSLGACATPSPPPSVTAGPRTATEPTPVSSTAGAASATTMPSGSTSAVPSEPADVRNPARFVTDQPYRPAFDPADFVDVIDNPLLPLIPGTTFEYRGAEHVVLTVTHDTRNVMGVTATVVTDEDYIDGALIEETYDWYAQDRWGNVWYLGEATAEIENGRPTSTHGSWEAGVEGARPGIVMLADPRPGDRYRQEFFRHEAEDVARIVSVDTRFRIPFGRFTGVLVTEETSPIEPGVAEVKRYAPGVGLIESRMVRGGSELVRLVKVTTGR